MAHRLVKIVVTLLVAALFLITMLAQRKQAQHIVATWGQSRAVLVAERSHIRGEVIKYETLDYPLALIPENAVTEIAKDTVATTYIDTGQVITAGVISSKAANLALPQPGEVSVTFKPVHQVPNITTGAIVDLWQIETRPTQGAETPQSRQVAQRVRVLDVVDGQISVAIRTEEAQELVQTSIRPLVVAVHEP